MLEEIARALDRLECAEMALEAKVQAELGDLAKQIESLEASERTNPIWLLQRIRCELMLGQLDRPLQDLQNLLHSKPAESVIQECLRILKHLDDPQSQVIRTYPAEALGDRVRFEQVMQQLPVLLQCQNLSQLHRRSCELARRLLRCHEVHWLQNGVLQFSTSPTPTGFSLSLLQSARQAQKPVAGHPSTHESLQLTEVESALAVPLPDECCLYALHKSLEQFWTADDLAVASMLAEVIGLCLDLLGQRLAEEQQTRKLWGLRSRLQYVVDISEVGLVWLDENQCVLDWNAWASYWLPGLRVGQPPSLPEQELPNVWKARGPEGNSRWIEAARESDLLVLHDASYKRLEDLLLLMETDRHQAAADLHDGPLQVVAARLQENSGTQVVRLWEEMQEHLRWLRSPLLEGLGLAEALTFAAQAFFQQAVVRIEGSEGLASFTQKLALYRCAFEMFEHLSDHAYPEELKLTVGEQEQLLWLRMAPILPELPVPSLQSSAAALSGASVEASDQDWLLKINWG